MSFVEARGIAKAFDATVALRRADLDLRRGSIHALVGENGAGKSTLIKILTGVHVPNAGSFKLDSTERAFSSPQEAIAAGIGAVHQERNLVPEFSIAENLFLHAPPIFRGVINYKKMYRDAAFWLDRIGLNVDVRASAGTLSVAQRQLVEIARALALEAKVLLLDEPTASITEREAEVLFDRLRDLRDQGTAILFVSHKLDEVFAICDRISVIRDGETIISAADRQALTKADVITGMVGRPIQISLRREAVSHCNSVPLLSLKGLATRFGHRSIDLSLGAGEITGLYGLVGSGRTELVRALLGMDMISAGEIVLRGRPIRVANPHAALAKYRIGYVSEDRKGEGLVLDHTIGHNVGITVWDRLKGLLGYITPSREEAQVGAIVERMAVKFTSLRQAVGQLSGGNQQKISVAKWLAANVDVLIVDEPTVGVDVRTKEDMYRLIEELAQSGKAILVISSDLAEIVRLSDDIYVMASKRLIAHLQNSGDYGEISGRVMHEIVNSQSRANGADLPKS